MSDTDVERAAAPPGEPAAQRTQKRPRANATIRGIHQRRIARALARRAKRVAAAGTALIALAVFGGCASQQRIDQDPLIIARQLEAAGFRGRLVLLFGGGHVGGLSYNVTGSSGFIELEVEPHVAPSAAIGDAE